MTIDTKFYPVPRFHSVTSLTLPYTDPKTIVKLMSPDAINALTTNKKTHIRGKKTLFLSFFISVIHTI